MPGVIATGKNLYHDGLLTDVAIAAFNRNTDMYIAQRLFPIVDVAKQGGDYFILDTDSWLRAPNTIRPPKVAPVEIEYQVSSEQYYCKNYAARVAVPDEDIVNANNPVAPLERGAEFVVDVLLRGYEMRVANIVTSGANLGSYVALTGTAKWSDIANSNPIADVTTAHAFIRSRTGFEANTMVIDAATLGVLKMHPLVVERFKYSTGGQVGDKQIAELFNVSNLLVGKAPVNRAPYNAAASITNVWGTSCILAYVPPTAPSMMTAAFGLTFRWSPPEFGAPLAVRRYPSADPGRKSTMVEAAVYQDEKVVARNLSYGILNTI